MDTAQEGDFITEEQVTSYPDGVKLYTKRWTPIIQKAPRALVIALHGFAEHTGRYDHVWPLFARRGVEVLAYDRRGSGKSGPNHGDTTLDQDLSDLQHVTGQEYARLGSRDLLRVPIFLYGHSMGGGKILTYLTRTESENGASQETKNRIKGVICAAPMILRSKPPGALLLWLAPWLVWLCPNVPFYKSINPSNLTSDPATMNSYHVDTLHDGNVYLKTVIEPLLAGHQLMDEGYKHWPASVSILVTHGELDPSTSCEASRRFVERIVADDKEFNSWPGMLHEGHNERPEIRDPFLEYTLGWIERRSAQL